METILPEKVTVWLLQLFDPVLPGNNGLDFNVHRGDDLQRSLVASICVTLTTIKIRTRYCSKHARIELPKAR